MEKKDKKGKILEVDILRKEDTEEIEEETENIYDSKQREAMLDDDEISSEEQAFMQGYNNPKIVEEEIDKQREKELPNKSILEDKEEQRKEKEQVKKNKK